MIGHMKSDNFTGHNECLNKSECPRYSRRVSELLSWGLVIVSTFALVTIGFAALQVVSGVEEFWIARGTFILAAVIALGRTIFWGITTSRGVVLRIAVCLMACGLIGALAIEASRYITRKQTRWFALRTRQDEKASASGPAANDSPVARLEMLHFKPKSVWIEGTPKACLVIPLRNDSGVMVRDVVAHIGFQNEALAARQEVNYGFWLEAERTRVTIRYGDTAHIALVSVSTRQIKSLDNKRTTKDGLAHCEKRPIPNGIWNVTIELIGTDFRQVFPTFRINVAAGSVMRVEDEESPEQPH